MSNSLVKIGIFYDGNYFAHVSNFYNYEHPRRARLSISGLHNYISHRVAMEKNADPRSCKVIDAHYFRGRLNVYDYPGDPSTRITNERVFDDILMSEGVTTHYLPLKVKEGRVEEKGVDLALALEAFESAHMRQYDVLVLIAPTSDYVPLVRKLHALGVAVMVLGWDFEFTDARYGSLRQTITSVDLLREASFPVRMEKEIGPDISHDEPIIEALFTSKEKKNHYKTQEIETPSASEGSIYQSHILTLKNGYGFIFYPPNNLYFHLSWLEGDLEFTELEEGDTVRFIICQNDQGQDVAKNVRLVEQD